MNEKTKFFAEYIQKQTGIVYSEANSYQLENRLQNLATQLSCKDIDELHLKCAYGMSIEIKQLLIDLATNNETSFFRDPSIFKSVDEHMLGQLLQGIHSGRKIRIWSAASSTGQEAYSLSILCNEFKGWQGAPNFEILGTDISEYALKRAESGKFTQLEIQRGLPTQKMLKYFEKFEGNDSFGENIPYWAVNSTIKKSTSFKKLNLLEEWNTIGHFDIVFIRNVLIYQDVENKKKVLEKVYQILNPGGFLVLGAAESLIGLSNSFEQIKVEATIFYQKK